MLFWTSRMARRNAYGRKGRKGKGNES